jgi:hypothetical protein
MPICTKLIGMMLSSATATSHQKFSAQSWVLVESAARLTIKSCTVLTCVKVGGNIYI